MLDNFDFDKYKLQILAWGLIVVLFSWVTLFYYIGVFFVSKLIFGNMNIYFQGILAGLTGGLWSWGIAKGLVWQQRIEKNYQKYTDSEYSDLLWKYNTRFLLFLGLDVLFIIIIKLTHFY